MKGLYSLPQFKTQCYVTTNASNTYAHIQECCPLQTTLQLYMFTVIHMHLYSPLRTASTHTNSPYVIERALVHTHIDHTLTFKVASHILSLA